MNVPFMDLGATNEALREEILAAIDRLAQGSGFILGPEVEALEERLAAYGGVRFAIGVSSGTDALLVSLMAFGIGAGDEVVTTAYSFFATAGAVARVGARPVFVDIDPSSYNMDPGGIEKALTPRTKAILPVHLFGRCAEVSSMLEVARQKGAWLIEDAAQAIGAETRDGHRAGSAGDVGCLSFYPTKNLGAWGDAGAVLTNDSTLAKKVRTLRVHGSTMTYHHEHVGGNFRLDALQAAVLRIKLEHLDSWTRKRQENAGRYRRLFEASGLEAVGLVIPGEPEDGRHIFNQFVIRAPRRDELKNYLRKRGIGTAVYYPVPLHLQPCFASLGYSEGDFPEAEKAARETLALPIYPELTPRQQELVVSAIEAFYRGT